MARKSVRVRIPPWAQKFRAISSAEERVAYIDEVAGPNPALPTRTFQPNIIRFN